MGEPLPHRQITSENFRAGIDDASPHSIADANIQRQQSGIDYETHPQYQSSASSGGASMMDMRSMSGALPDYAIRNYPQSLQHMPMTGGNNTPSQMYQYPHGAQFAGQTGSAFSLNSAQQYHHFYTQGQQRHSQFSGLAGSQAMPAQPQSFQNAGLHLPQGMVQNMQGHPQMQQFLHAHPQQQYVMGYHPRGGFPQPLRIPNVVSGGSFQGQPPNSVSRTSSDSSMQAASSSVLRGPPRKPKQSGHALWVGNLPPGTLIIDLKDHFSRDATDDIESVFLISKSNCAFVNYKSEESCQAAMTRFHDSRFQGVRLVCRLRRGNTASASQAPQPTIAKEPTAPDAPTSGEQDEPASAGGSDEAPQQSREKVLEKFFVVKSLTTEDLERSVQSGVWATQAHNEAALSQAFQSAENVYLIFSANKSGEYFGYARMDSAIGDEEAATKTELPTPTSQPPVASSTPTDVPLTIATAATATAPKGRIIDDSSRGTIFWEADITSPEADAAKSEADDTAGSVSAVDTGYDSAVSGPPSASPGSATPQSFGKPFKITWISTDRLPFYRTRGLRNPWNANREVKIARDGTEIEPSVGRRLTSMFGQPFPVQQPQPGGVRPMPPTGPAMGGFMGQGMMATGYGRGF